MSLGKQLLRGGAIAYGSFIAGKALSFISTLILARVLLPGDFGLVGYALLILSFFDMLKTLGVASAVIYRQDLTDDRASEIFMLAVASALVFYVLCWLFAPVAAGFFHTPRIILVIRLLGLTLLLDALGQVHSALLQKNMRFMRRYIPGLLQELVKGSVAIGLALAGHGFWSLVWGQLAGSMIGMLACWWVYPWRPSLRFQWTSARVSLNYGLVSTLVAILGTVIVNADSVVVGRMLGSVALGIYDLAVTLPQMLTIYLAGAISQAAFPAFASLQKDRKALCEGYLIAQRYSALILLPIGFGFCAVVPAFVHAFYTPVWWPMIPVMQSLTIFSTINVISWSSGDLFKATGRLDVFWKLDIFHVMTLIPALILGANLDGILGVAIAQIAIIVPYRLIAFWLVHRIAGIEYGAIMAAVRVALAASLSMLGMCLLVSWAVAPHLAPGVVLLVQIAIGAAVYIGLVVGLDAEVRTRLRTWRRRITETTPMTAAPSHADQPNLV